MPVYNALLYVMLLKLLLMIMIMKCLTV